MIYNYTELQEKVTAIDSDKLYTDICKNIKRLRQQKCQEFKTNYHDNTINPYSSETSQLYSIIITIIIKDLKAKMIVLKEFL